MSGYLLHQFALKFSIAMAEKINFTTGIFKILRNVYPVFFSSHHRCCNWMDSKNPCGKIIES